VSFDLQLADRRALVTGGTKGVGAAVVEVLRDARAKVVAAARAVPVQPTAGVDARPKRRRNTKSRLV
jgi:NAD(P)-dependent dehydrogenase (short-subunit alcohol dehydrogenase family)